MVHDELSFKRTFSCAKPELIKNDLGPNLVLERCSTDLTSVELGLGLLISEVITN